jgi:histidinol-phosphatase
VFIKLSKKEAVGPDAARTVTDDAVHRGLTDDLRLGHLLADPNKITVSRFHSFDLHIISRPDLTPVSDDAKAAAQGRPSNAQPGARPHDAVQGEEMAYTGRGRVVG